VGAIYTGGWGHNLAFIETLSCIQISSQRLSRNFYLFSHNNKVLPQTWERETFGAVFSRYSRRLPHKIIAARTPQSQQCALISPCVCVNPKFVVVFERDTFERVAPPSSKFPRDCLIIARMQTGRFALIAAP
jgi:hypothetical protein